MPRPRKFDEQDVLEAARDAFWRDGYAGTSVQDLTEATGLKTQSLYGAFGSKHDLFLRVLDEYGTRQAAGLESAVATDSSPWHGLKAAVTFEDGGRLDLPQQGCLMANSTAALSAQDEEVRTRACQAYEGTLALFSRQITAAQERGEIDGDLDADQTARALIAVMQGIEFLHKSGIGDDELRLAKDAVLHLIGRAAGEADA
ncbi:TetR/AcrR family transcriptional regulator [Mumia quercus]|uniref:TetR/AcrR family transcriptional regulator n=1 Tax=Mumia quercus TaxID=2976125 RepID=UPI0021CFABDC|nr:TetR/AcrR family transcriptional regulator [Mumia quercus]